MEADRKYFMRGMEVIDMMGHRQQLSDSSREADDGIKRLVEYKQREFIEGLERSSDKLRELFERFPAEMQLDEATTKDIDEKAKMKQTAMEEYIAQGDAGLGIMGGNSGSCCIGCDGAL